MHKLLIVFFILPTFLFVVIRLYVISLSEVVTTLVTQMYYIGKFIKYRFAVFVYFEICIMYEV